MGRSSRRGRGACRPAHGHGLPHRAARRLGARMRRAAASRRRDAAHLHRRHRERQRRARPDRAQRRAGARLAPARRIRPPRILRAALAAHQHHRLRATARRRDGRHAQSAPARLCRSHHALVRRASGDPQRHSRSRLHRYRLARTVAGTRRHPLAPSTPRCGASRTGSPKPRSQVDHRRAGRYRLLRGRRETHPPDPLQPAVERGRLLLARPDHPGARPARRAARWSSR